MNVYVVILVYFSYLCFQWLTWMAAAINAIQAKSKNINNIFIKDVNRFGPCFFTLWVYGLQMVFVGTAILDELSKLLSANATIQKRLGRFRAFIFNTFVFPCSILVFSVFWTIWQIDRELIFPKAIDLVLPAWINHSLHTLIIIPIVIEVLLPKKYSFVTFSKAVKILTVFLFIYQLIYFSIYFLYGVWLYPVYKIMSWPQRIVFTLVQFSLALIYLKIGTEIQNRKKVNGRIKVK